MAQPFIGKGPQIIYGAIAQGHTVLAEHSVAGGNVSAIAKSLLSKVPQGDGQQAAYKYDEYRFNYVSDSGILTMCLTDEEFKLALGFVFLRDIHDVAANSPESNYKSTLVKRIEFYNSGQADKLGNVKDQVEGVKGVMVQNIDKILERHERVDVLCEKTAELASGATSFRRDAKKVRQTEMQKKIKIIAAISGICVGFVALIILIIAL
eukprot:TRINITY_DN3741_c0_g1_i1.p1 TRINITY_DN3741_c0_g1~~TRINITY_DN3741_c0_g1_i1.p1  ORF type:complete len:208 (+),score=30.53 TRINITY_DN3741_c0_g1_i1:44-667(+)